MKFGKDYLTKLKAEHAGKADRVVWDDDTPGFGVRIRGKARRWLVQYRSKGKQHRETLGDIDRVSLAAARAAAQQRFGQLAIGIDPSAERTKAKSEAAAAKRTLKHVSDKYLEARADAVRPATLRAAKWHLETLWAPLHGRPIADISRAVVAARLAELVKANGRVSAARARGTLSALYNWAAGEGWIETNPVSFTNDPNEGAKSRDRELSDGELRAVWCACGDASDFARIVRLLLLTGCRRHEIGGMLWRELDDNDVLRIPASRTKNHAPLWLPLPPTALDILRSIERRPDNEHVFGTSKNGFTAWSYGLATLNVRIAANEGRPLNGWRLHDLRRSTRTGLGRLGVAPHVAERVIGHLPAGKIERTYDLNRYFPEIGAALRLWSDHLLTVVGDNVVPLRAS